MTAGRDHRGGFTLIELLLSLTVTAVLFVGLSSALLLATKGMPDEDGVAMGGIEAGRALDRMVDDLMLATTMIVTEADRVEFLVTDATGDDAADQIGYEVLDGTLMRTVGGVTEPLVTGVAGLELTYESVDVASTPAVLLVVDDAVNPNSDDVLRVTTFSNAGFSVDLISDDALADEIEAKRALANVVYISSTVESTKVGGKFSEITEGIVCEESYLSDELELAASVSGFYGWATNVVDAAHPITEPVGTGWLTVSAWTVLASFSGAMADGAVLTRNDDNSPAMLAVERGQSLTSGSAATGRRVLLPFGSFDFEFSSLQNRGKDLAVRAIEWAAASARIVRIRVELELSRGEAYRYETEVPLMVRPEA